MELKTLKDLKCHDDGFTCASGNCEGPFPHLILTLELHEEIIKWIKHFRTQNKYCYCAGCRENSPCIELGKADALEHIFNITEEDLK